MKNFTSWRATTLGALALVAGLACTASAQAWKFGVISDTQWTCTNDPSGLNPNGVPVSIINQINPQFINAGVKFVVQIGDLTENGEDADEAVRAAAAQPLLNAGIGFFPMRGNHETYSTNNNSFAIPAFQANYPQTRGLANTFGAANFSSPTAVSTDLDGMSYSFDFGTPDSTARFVILDNWVTMTRSNGAAGYPYGYSFGDQQDWISGQLNKNTRGAQHAFVFSHQPLIAENHQDSPFVGYTDANTNMQNAFFASLQTNGVRYYISGHDHVHQHSIITSPDGLSQVEEIIGASDSSKFYTPKAISNTNWFGQKARELSLSQDRYTVGYYIYTVDGPRVTVDYYADDHGNWSSDNQYPTATSTNLGTHVTPTFHFVKKETFGYSLNGQSFLVHQGQAYTNVQDSIAAGGGYLGTAAKILGGVNASTTLDGSARPLTKQVSTGWSPASATASDVLTLWGLTEVGKSKADTCVLSLSYDAASVTLSQINSGAFCLASKDSFGHWVNTVDANIGGRRQFVLGAYSSAYPLGTYGVDTASQTVWAVVNHQGDFAAATVSEIVNFVYTSDNHYGIVRPIFRGNFNVSGQAVNEAMIARMNTLPAQSFPNDGGVAAGQTVGHVDFLMDTGDIANRSETNGTIAANPALNYLGSSVNYTGNPSYISPVSSVTWSQWQHDYLGDTNTGNRAGGLLTLTNSAGQGIPVFLSPGNHDVSDAIGMNNKIPAANVDATSFAQIYNRMTPYSGKLPITTSVFANPGDYTNVNNQVNYSFNIGGVHVLCVNMFPDKNILNWMSADLASIPTSTPVFLFCHAPVNMAAGETKVFGTPTNTSSSAGADIPFKLSGTDSANSYVDMNAAKQYVADWLVAHGNVRALFSGHDNFNGATNWNGQDPNGNLIAARDSMWPGVTLFRVDSPMKGDVSGASATGALAGIGNETNLSFQVYSLDVANRKLTEREFQWNPTADDSGNGVWSGQSTTIDLNFPSSPATLAGPANGTTVTAYPTLAWSAVNGATSYLVTLVGPAGTNYYTTTGTKLPISLAQSGAYSWTVLPLNATGSGSVSVANTFNVAAGAWSFGVIDDTQWTCTNDPSGLNPNGVPVSIINQINPQFINAGVKFVVQIGDLTENGEDADEAVRAAAAQPLLDAGIGFFPMRGNHETYSTNNNGFAIPAFQANYPQTRGLTNTFGAANFNSPTAVSTDLDGMSYSFDFGTPDSTARFVFFDGWATPSKVDTSFSTNYPFGYSIADQQGWLSSRLDRGTRGTPHAFFFSHRNLMGENHQDTLFNGYANANTNMQNAFFACLQSNGVKYAISGHDHVHQRSIVTSPDGLSQVEEIIGASDSSKFYIPKAVSNTNWFGQKARELSLSQERYTVGYYIYTVDGPRVTVDYYADDHGNWSSDNQYPTATSTNLGTHVTPTFHFVKKETFGYSLNGQSFLVAQGQAYTNVQDSIAAGGGYLGTAAKILGGVNASTTLDGSARPLTKEVSTGWSPTNGTASDILTLWGLTEVGASHADTYALSLNYNPAAATAAQLANGLFGLVSKDTNGAWVNAVNLNAGGNAQFVFGPYASSYSLGTYGVDTNSGTVWAVVNYQGNFAAGAVNNRTNLSALRIATLSDIHYMDPSLLIANGSAFQTYLGGDRKLLAESAAIDTAAIDAVIAQQPDILLVSGDLTKDGEYVSHLAVSNLLARVQASGTLVYVIPGNHDVNNANAMSFDGSVATPVANVTPEQFSAIYAPFGYNTATTVARDPNSLAYVVEPVAGLWILCLDSCQYTGGQNPTEGSFTAQRLNWITNELAQAQASGKVVIGMMHHGLLEHFPGQKTLFSEYVLDNYQTVASLFASYGMKLVFTGHFHAQDIVQGTFNGNTIYDIETGSTVTYPCPYRVIDLQANGQLVINSHRISSINYNLGSAPDFQTYAYNYLTNGMVPLSAYMLQAPPFSLDSGTANYLAPAVSEAMVDHYIGDEPGLAGASPATQAIVSGLLAGNAQQQQLGGAIYSILTDTAPADNNLTLTLTAGQITGPATNTVIMSGTPTLTWAPVWGAGSYNVTVTGPGYSRSFVVTGTSYTLPSGLANGSYTWTVTPNTGSVSSTGGFALDYPPTLGIEPSTNGVVHVYWPVSSYSTYQLQFSPDLSGTNWVNVSSNGFFRLAKP